MKSQEAYLQELDILRTFAAIAVVVFHFGIWSYPFRIGWIESIFQSANIAVGFFFFLSGFILVYVNRENFKEYSFNVKSFYKKRLIRIIPAYFLAMVLMWFAYFLHFGYFPYIKHFLLEALLIQSWVPGFVTNVNFVGWSLSVEMFFYLLFPLLFLMLVKKTKTFFVFTFIFWLITNILTIVLAFNFNQESLIINQFTKFFPLLHLSTFMFGMYFSKLFVSKSTLINRFKDPVILISIVLFFILYFQVIPYKMLIAQHNGLLLPLFIALVFGVLNFKGEFKKFINTKVFILLGKASYGIYIYQAVVYYFMYWFYKKIGVFDLLKEEGRFFIYIIVLLFVSILSYQFFERKVRYFLSRNNN